MNHPLHDRARQGKEKNTHGETEHRTLRIYMRQGWDEELMPFVLLTA
jgi:hypothetical protein